MKRTPLKRKSPLKARSGLKRTSKAPKRAKLSKRGKSPVSVLQGKLWEHCKRITRARYGNTCYTCGVTGLEGFRWQTGHFIARSVGGAYLRYDLRNLRPQCPRCNVHLSGNGAIFYRLLVEREGQEYVDKIFEDRKVTVKASEHYAQLLEQYSGIDG